MKKVLTIVFALTLMLGAVSFAAAEPVSNSAAIRSHVQQVTVKKKKGGIARRTYRGGKYVVKKVYVGGKWVTKKVWHGTKWTGKKTWKTGRKVVSRTKKVVY